MAKTREELFYAHKLNLDERNTAIDDYEEILELDSTCAEENYQLGRLKQEDFLEYYRSGILDLLDAVKPNTELSTVESDGYSFQNLFERIGMQFRKSVIGSKAIDELNLATSSRHEYIDFSEESFDKAEKYLLRAIQYSPDNRGSYLLLSKIYLEKSLIEKGIEVLKSFFKRNPLDAEVNLLLGLFSYRPRSNEEADKYFKRAIALMSYEEKEVYIYYSVQLLIGTIQRRDID